jgi:hypothetical protein
MLQDPLVIVSVQVGSNKTIDKNATVQHCRTDHDAKGGNPHE